MGYRELKVSKNIYTSATLPWDSLDQKIEHSFYAKYQVINHL